MVPFGFAQGKLAHHERFDGLRMSGGDLPTLRFFASLQNDEETKKLTLRQAQGKLTPE